MVDQYVRKNPKILSPDVQPMGLLTDQLFVLQKA